MIRTTSTSKRMESGLGTTNKNNMAKAILEFNLNEEQYEFEQAVNAGKFRSVLWDLDQFLRSKTKYASDDATEEQLAAYYELRDELHKLIEENNITLD